MALAVLGGGALPPSCRTSSRPEDARWFLGLVPVALLAVLIVGDPGRIDRDSTWLRVMTGTLIGVISLVNAIAVVRLVAPSRSARPNSPMTPNPHFSGCGENRRRHGEAR